MNRLYMVDRSPRWLLRGGLYSGLLSLALILVLLPRPVQATLMSTFVDNSYGTSASYSGQIYDSAFVSVFVDPSVTHWIAWNNASSLVLANAGCSGGLCLGPGGFGSDDYIRITVTDPGGASLSANLDRNDASGVSYGIQNVIMGTAAVAPDALRQRPYFAYPPGQIDIFDEAGALSSIFTSAGMYGFRFDFVNSYSNAAGHSDIWLLQDTTAKVSEPSTLVLLALGMVWIAVTGKRPGKFRGSLQPG